jgi:basic membrane protein A and related proteins
MKRGVGVALALGVLVLLIGATGADGRPQLRVGLVLEETSVSRASVFEHGAFVGLQRAVKELGVKGKVVASSPTASNLVPGFSYLARQKYDLIIGVGFLEAADLDVAALRFPTSRFAILDARREDLKHSPKNVRGTLFKTEEAGYLAGYLAALLEKRRPGKDVVSTVGGYPLPTVDAYIAGFQAGARRADPGIVTLNGYANSFAAADKCKTWLSTRSPTARVPCSLWRGLAGLAPSRRRRRKASGGSGWISTSPTSDRTS